MNKRVQGSVLIIVLLLIMVLFLMGMTMLGIKSTQAKSAVMTRYSIIAREIAIAGIEDARVKLTKDIDFPPGECAYGAPFSYCETLQYCDTEAPVGEYLVNVDFQKNDPTQYSSFDNTIKVTSVGTARGPNNSIMARYRISALLDTRKKNRFGAGANPRRYKYIEWQDHGSL